MHEQKLHIDGLWKVTALGMARPMNLLGDKKLIKNGLGHNIMLGKKWGWFKVEPYPYGRLCLNYDDPRNNKTLRGVRDIIGFYGNDGWLGKLLLNGERKFWFRLRRV